MIKKITIEIIYALPERQYFRKIITEEGTTVKQVIITSNLLVLFNEIDLNKNKFGIHGRLVKLTDVVKEGDRVEIYRPILADPRELRRRRIKTKN